jgi:hypothetical protein
LQILFSQLASCSIWINQGQRNIVGDNRIIGTTTTVVCSMTRNAREHQTNKDTGQSAKKIGCQLREEEAKKM